MPTGIVAEARQKPSATQGIRCGEYGYRTGRGEGVDGYPTLQVDFAVFETAQHSVSRAGKQSLPDKDMIYHTPSCQSTYQRERASEERPEIPMQTWASSSKTFS
jgi:hypothetical protein